VAVVGVCAAGKSALVSKLVALGYDARVCGQEHSEVPDMWQHLSRPQVLIVLAASWRTVLRRREVPHDEVLYGEQRRRLAHAEAHCDLLINTDALSETAVLARALAVLDALGIRSR
jgi:hypothetical protein